MADGRAVRSTGRRKPPTPQPSAKPSTAARQRGTRATSRDVDLAVEPARPVGRSARQGSVASIVSEGDQDGQGKGGRRTKRNAQKKTVADLTIVEEMDTHINFEDAPKTPPLPPVDVAIPHPSPGAVSEMSGTTAISSFSDIDAEMLKDRFIVRHLSWLHQATHTFLDHLVPDEGHLGSVSEQIRNDDKRVKYMQQPDSSFVADYNDYNHILAPHLPHFRLDHQQYISHRAVHRALFGPNRDVAASRTGIDLILYQTNLLIFAKDMIHTDRRDKTAWDLIRSFDNLFPALFLPTLIVGGDTSQTLIGNSTLLKETFELALDLRTQLAILLLERRSREDDFDPDEALSSVFLESEDDGPSVVRGWGVSALGGEDSALPEAFQSKVIERCQELRKFFQSDDDAALVNGDVDLDSLGEAFPWRLLILRLLGWVRLRKAELRTALTSIGGIQAVEERIQLELQNPSHTNEPAPPRASPRKKRTSFGRNRRRSNRKFDPLAGLDTGVLNKLKAKERLSGIQADPDPDQIQTEVELQVEGSPQATQAVEKETEKEEEMTMVNAPEAELEPTFGDDMQEEGIATATAPEVELEPTIGDDMQEEGIATANAPEVELEPTFGDDIQEQVEEQAEERVEDTPRPSQPPRSTAGFLNLLKQDKKKGKENRMVSNIFERQPGAVRADFGGGFDDDTQPISRPPQKAKQPQSSASTKRPRPADFDSDRDSDDAFQTENRTAKVQERREKAKRARIDTASSAAPPSHQPRALSENGSAEVDGPPTSNSEVEAPDMTEEAPPASTFADQRSLARSNIRVKPRKANKMWTVQEEEAFVEYMAELPHRYKDILVHDKSMAGKQLLKDRTQVNLKDKARNMAIVMIKSGTGLKTGFENVISETSKEGIKLREDGYIW